MSNDPKVSMIVPTFNEEHNLPKLLKTLKNQSYPNFEIIVVDGRSTDNTRSLAQANNCKVVENPARYAEIGKYLGVKNSKSQFVAFIDADNEPASSDWLTLMMKPLNERGELCASFCLYHPSRFSKFDNHYMNLYYSLLGNDPISWYIGGLKHAQKEGYHVFEFDEASFPLDLALANGTIVRRELLSEFQWSDDIYPLMLLAKQGKKFACVYDTYLHHNHLTNYASFCRKYITRARNRNIYRKEITGTRLFGRRLRLIKWILYSSSLIGPLIDVGKLYKTWPEKVWFIHPLACATQTLIYAAVNRARLSPETPKLEL
jgi:glycosyltransferase involved in cell wall biosynthesis